MNWQFVSGETGVETLHKLSSDPSIGAILIFKHSSRCSISKMVKDRLERKWVSDPEKYPVFLIEVLTSRPASDLVTQKYDVGHQSPQVLMIKGGKCIYTASHSEIAFEEIREHFPNS